MAETRRQVIIGTAGHVDHGKTALVKALTGIDADTLAEEKRRGITIELGFVFMEVPAGAPQIVFIDVPGHEKLIRTMVAGASSLQSAMLVIAADEGIQPQTREHADILRLLGVTRGLVALTKCDLVDADGLDLVTDQVRTFLGETSIPEADIIPVSAVTGAGIEDLRRALIATAETVPERSDSGIFRMPVDRVFTLHGFGTVIAGTVLSGQVRPGDRVTVYPEQLEGRVRAIQVHNEPVEVSGVGQRTAINIPDIRKDDLRRGQCAAAPGSLSPTTRLDVRLLLLAGPAGELKNRARVRLHVGTEEVLCSVVLLDRDRLLPGEEAPAQLLLESPTVAVHGDRLVVRSLTPLMTIGGGMVLDPTPGKHRRRADGTLEAFERLEGTITEVVEQSYVKGQGQPQTAAQVALALGRGEEEVAAAVEELRAAGKLVVIGGDKEAAGPPLCLHAASYEALAERLLAAVNEYFQLNRYRTHMPAADLQSRLAQRTTRPVLVALLRDLRKQGRLLVTERGFSLPDRGPELAPAERAGYERLETRFREAGLSPPAEETVREELGLAPPALANLMLALLDAGALARLPEKVTFHASALEQAEEVVVDLMTKEGILTAAQLRDGAGCSRKHAIALLEYFDGKGLTRRTGDHRVPGPKFAGEV